MEGAPAVVPLDSLEGKAKQVGCRLPLPAFILGLATLSMVCKVEAE